jgi:hypothetical protein
MSRRYERYGPLENLKLAALGAAQTANFPFRGPALRSGRPTGSGRFFLSFPIGHIPLAIGYKGGPSAHVGFFFLPWLFQQVLRYEDGLPVRIGLFLSFPPWPYPTGHSP